MRILVITPFYAPDLGPSAALYEMLCENMVRLGCEVSVICAVPHYPTGRVPVEYRGHLIQREDRNGVDVIRVWVPSVNRARLAQRLLSFVCYQILAAIAGLTSCYDVLIASNPALEIALPLLYLGVLRRKPIIYSVHEIYPDIGTKLRIFRHRPVIKILDSMERFFSHRAARVRALSEGYKRALETRGVRSSKVAVIPDWVDTDFIRPLPRRNAFSARWNLDSSFVVMYAGNIGLTQGLDQVLQAARLLATEPAVSFVFVGNGAARMRLQQAAESANLTNVKFMPFQPRELLPRVLASADVSLIALKRGFGSDSIPSKFYSILASGRPVIAAVDSGTDTWDLIHQASCGLCVEPENPQALADAILDLYRDEEDRTRLGMNGRVYAVKYHSEVSAAREFYGLARDLAREEPLEETLTHGQPV